MLTFLQAIARQEGFYSKGSRPNRNNNPGDLEFHSWQLPFGAATDGRFAIFPTTDAGFAAMKALFGFPLYKGLTVEEALNKWAPTVENQTSTYITHVCSWVGCQPTDIIDPLVEAS